MIAAAIAETDPNITAAVPTSNTSSSSSLSSTGGLGAASIGLVKPDISVFPYPSYDNC